MPVLDPNLITPGQHERRVSHEPCLSGLHTHPPVLVFFYEQGINPLAIGADVLDAIV
jgi:hypothetical protein